jgi:hypothetical protein
MGTIGVQELLSNIIGGRLHVYVKYPCVVTVIQFLIIFERKCYVRNDQHKKRR